MLWGKRSTLAMCWFDRFDSDILHQIRGYMKLFEHMKDGGEDSNVHGYFLCEIKCLFSIAILVFEDGSRDAYHSHAFNAISWMLKGKVLEEHIDKVSNNIYPSWKPFITTRECFHKVTSFNKSYFITFRGPWKDTWSEYIPKTKEYIKLTFGRKRVK